MHVHPFFDVIEGTRILQYCWFGFCWLLTAQVNANHVVFHFFPSLTGSVGRLLPACAQLDICY